MNTWQIEEYRKFGEFVTFDTTFKTNSFGFPVGSFVGVDNNGKTVCFAMCLVARETIESFEWVFQQLLEATGKSPPVIYTDEDPAMNRAIQNVFPDTKHRLCCWHLERNLRKKILSSLGGISYKIVRKTFWKLAKYDLGEEFYESEMQQLLTLCAGKESAIQAINHLHQQRVKWVKSFNRSLFCMDQSSTSRAESVNSIIKRYQLNKKIATVKEFTENMDKILCEHMRQSRSLMFARTKMTGLKFQVAAFPFCDRYPTGLTQFAVDKFEEQLKFAMQNFNSYEITSTGANQEEVKQRSIVYNGNHNIQHIVSVREAHIEDYKDSHLQTNAQTIIPLDCTCSWRSNWMLPCRHMFKVAIANSSPCLEETAFSSRWTLERESSLAHIPYLSSQTRELTQRSEEGKENDNYVSWTNIMAHLKPIVSDAVSQGYSKQLLDHLQVFDSMMKTPPSPDTQHHITNNPPVLRTKSGRKRKSEGAMEVQSEMNNIES